MKEKVLVVESKDFNLHYGDDNNRIIRVDEKSFLDYVNSKHKFISRDLVENDFNYKQIISYCLIKYKNYVFMTKRKNTQSERRLHNLYSVGIGGHINSIDMSEKDNILIIGMQRELFEEVSIETEYNYNLLGIINDNSTNVNKVHAGVCFIVELKEKKCGVKENHKMDGEWISFNDLQKYHNYLEIWSKILINSIKDD